MSILVSNIRIPYNDDDRTAAEIAVRDCKCGKAEARIYKKSLDLRHGKLTKVFTIIIDCENEELIVERAKNSQIRLKTEAGCLESGGEKKLEYPPVIVGFGPAGIFAALILAENGYKPIVIEQGQSIEARDESVDRFNRTGALNTKSNIQFGEGGAGAYSDGKLTTRINDPRCELVLEKLLQYGAPEEIAISAKPHIGTDLLKNIVVEMRKKIIELGGTVLFGTEASSINCEDNVLKSITTANGEIPCEAAVLAVGHSARKMFESLQKSGIAMEQKAFSVGVRIEHLQMDINRGLYGKFADKPELPPAEYALSLREGSRACYTFCMCPGGSVVAAASESGMVVTNGMSLHARDGVNANSALAVSVLPGDFGSRDALAGIEFQRRLESEAFMIGGGNFAAPVQRLGDFIADKNSMSFGKILPTYPRGVQISNLNNVLPTFVCKMIKDAMPLFNNKIHGFNRADALLTGVESRTSSPLRIVRDEDMQSPSAKGLIPCGEGAGYAGGIMSAAVDGIRAAESIMSKYKAD